ncbi:MAG: molybdopterin-dependent oxidoreductase [Dehalococcoidia bacterium]|nr:molybdopterin-dependent oxidoreductase [Dehalococcoidia bacterium]
MRRREFLQLAAVSSAGSVAFAGCYIPMREMRVQSPVRHPSDIATGIDNYYATACPGCSAGCGVLVRVVEGRAKKVEGNPDHPVNVGKTCVVAQGMVQMLYHPARLRTAQRLNGDRGSGRYQDVPWATAIAEVAGRLRNATGGRLFVMTRPLGGPQEAVVNQLVQGLGGTRLILEPLEETVYRAAARQVFGSEQLPDYDLPRARTIVSFGADWLGPWGNQARLGAGYGAFRQDRAAVRGYLIHIDTHYSMTAANADEYVPVRPGREGLLALAIAQSMIAQNIGDRSQYPSGGAQALANFAPERVAEQTGVPADKIREIARRMGDGPTVVIGGGSAGAHTNGLANLTQILSLNVLLGAVNAPGGVRFNPTPALTGPNFPVGGSRFTDWQRELIRLRQVGANAVVLVYDANPVFALPASLGAAEAIRGAGTVVSFSSMLDETSHLADFLLPADNPLEEWSVSQPEAGPQQQVITVSQPVVNRVFDTRSFGDTLLELARAVGGAAATGLTAPSMREAAQQLLRPAFERRVGSVTAPTFDQFWNGVLQRGGWWTTQATATGSPRGFSAPPSIDEPRFSGDEAQGFRYHLVLFAAPTLGRRGWAEAPLLQQQPDPTTTVAWSTWAELNPNVARQLGVREGDLIQVETATGGRMTVPVYINFGTPDWTVAIPVGNGHTVGSEFSRNKGVNPLPLLADLTEAQTGALAWAATRVRLSRTGQRLNLTKLEGYVTPVQFEDGPVAEVTNED